jgi:putative intracellular protease/amidase
VNHVKKKVLVYLYPQFREVEIMTTLSIVGKKYEVLPFSLLPGTVTSECGLMMQPTIKMKNISPMDYELLIIPGGKQVFTQGNPRLLHLLQVFNREEIKIAAIGNGAAILGRAGLLNDRSYTASFREDEFAKAGSWLNGHYVPKQLVEDKNILTAKSHAYIDFGLTIGDRLKCFDGLEEYNFYKGTSSF